MAPGAFADARDIAARIQAPPNYLAKLLGQLGRAGFVEARKGAGGGFRLARPASELSLYDLLEPVEQLMKEGDCILGGNGCDGKTPCALHDRWGAVRALTLDFLKNTRLDSLVSKSDIE